MSCAKITTTRSTEVTGTISPYPMVVMVVVAQYTHAAYFAKRDWSSRVSGAVPWVSASTSTHVATSSGASPYAAYSPPRPEGSTNALFCTACVRNHAQACQCASVRTTHMNLTICHAPYRTLSPRSRRASARVTRSTRNSFNSRMSLMTRTTFAPRYAASAREDVPARDAPGGGGAEAVYEASFEASYEVSYEASYEASVSNATLRSSGKTRSNGTDANTSSGAQVFVYVHATARGSSTTRPRLLSTYPVR